MPRELRDGVWWLDFRGVNAYLVDDGDLTLVDAGMPWHGDDVVDAPVALGYDRGDLDRVLVTHFDVDHVGGLDRLAGLDVAVHAGQGDAALVAGRESPPLLSRKGALQRALGVFRSNPRVEVAPLADGETVGGFTVYETPGHTPGHVVYVNERVEAAFLGDLVRETDGRLEPSPWVLSDDVDRVRESVRELSERAPPFEMAAMGHGVPFERDGKDRLDELAATL